MANVIADLQAIRTFFQIFASSNGQSLAASTASRQVAPLLKKINSATFTPTEAGAAIEIMNKAPFSQVEKQELGTAIASNIGSGERNAANRTQVFLIMNTFLTIGLVKMLLTGSAAVATRDKLSMFAEFCVHLGLRWPLEKTCQYAVGLFLSIAGANHELSDDDKLATLRMWK